MIEEPGNVWVCAGGKGLDRMSPHLRCRVVVEESHVELVDAAEHLAQLRVRPRRDHGGHCDTSEEGEGKEGRNMWRGER